MNRTRSLTRSVAVRAILGILPLLPLLPETVAAAFQNLGFEAANTNNGIVPPGGSVQGLLPGWEYNPGGQGYSTMWPVAIDDVYLGGTVGEAYLMTAGNGLGFPVVGKYGVYFEAAYLGGPWIETPSSLRQTGTIPAGTKSLQFLDYYTYATGLGPYPYVEVRINGSLVPLYNSLVGVRPLQTVPQWSIFTFESFVNISAYAGQQVTLEFTIPDRQMGLDDIQFSPFAVVPEPATWVLLGLGLTGWLWARARH